MTHLIGEHHPRPAAVFEATRQEVARHGLLLGERKMADFTPVDLQVFARQTLEANRHVGDGLLMERVNRSRRTAARHTEPQPPYGCSGSSRASSIMRTPLSPCFSHSAICSRNASTLDFRRRPDGCRSTGSLSARATALRLRPSSVAISRWLLPRLCSRWIVLRSMRRNTLLPALLGWATVSVTTPIYWPAFIPTPGPFFLRRSQLP